MNRFGVAAGLICILTFGGCLGGGGETCDFWVDTLKKGKKEKAAIEKVGELGCKEAEDELLKRFPETNYRREVLGTIQKLGQSEKTVEIVRSALPDKEVGPLAIQLAIEWRVKTIQDDVTKLIRSRRSAKTRQQALEALVELIAPPIAGVGGIVYTGKAGRGTTDVFVNHIEMDFEKYAPGVTVEGDTVFIKADFKKGVTAGQIQELLAANYEAVAVVDAAAKDKAAAVPATPKKVQLTRSIKNESLIKTLIWVVGEEPTLQGVDCNTYAADRLKEVPWKEMDNELTVAAAQNLVKALFMTDARSHSAQINARFALRAIGSPAVDPILTAFKGINKELNEFAEVRGLPKWRYTQGHELVEMLWDVGDRRASPALMEAIGIPLDPPPPDVARLPEDQRVEWQTANQNRLTTTALTVGALPNDDAVRYAVALLKRKTPPPEATQFVQAGLGLALMGTKKSREALWQLFNEGGDVDVMRARVTELKALVDKESDAEKKKTLMKEHDTTIDTINGIQDRQANYVINLAVGLGPEHLDDFQKKVFDVEKGPIAEASKQALPLAYFNVVKTCKANAKCYGDRLAVQKGKLKDVPDAIMAAQQGVLDRKKAMKEEIKPFNDELKEANKLIKAKLDEIMAVKKQIADIDELSAAEKKKQNDKRNTLIQTFNDGLDAYNAKRDGLKTIHDKRNKVIDTLAPFETKVTDALGKVHELEKAVLTLGTFEDGESQVGMLVDLFIEAEHPTFTQFRQWALISLEHLATKKSVADLERLLAAESKDGERSTFWTLRLESLISRVKRG